MKALLVAVLTLVGVKALAAGDAGCGLGSLIIQKNSKGLQLLAMTTNSFLFTQPLGITSGTSGCSSRGIVQADKEMEYFVEVNHQDLSREMAQGTGEKLNVLAGLNGCQTEEAKLAFAELTQKSYGKILPQAEVTPADMVQNIKREVKSNQQTAHLCQVASL